MTIQQMAWKKKLKKNTKKLNELSDLENKIEQNRKRLLIVENFFNLLILEPKQFFQNFWVTNRSYTEHNIKFFKINFCSIRNHSFFFFGI